MAAWINNQTEKLKEKNANASHDLIVVMAAMQNFSQIEENDNLTISEMKDQARLFFFMPCRSTTSSPR